MSQEITAADIKAVLSAPVATPAGVDVRIAHFASKYCDIRKFIEAARLVDADPTIVQLLPPVFQRDPSKMVYEKKDQALFATAAAASVTSWEIGATLISLAQWESKHPGIRVENASEADLGSIAQKGCEIYKQFKGKDASCHAGGGRDKN